MDIEDRVKSSVVTTQAWAKASGYREPGEEGGASKMSQKARNCQRIINKSDFGCQQRNVALLVSAMIGEEFDVASSRSHQSGPCEYLKPLPPKEGVALAYVGETNSFGHQMDHGAVGMYCHISANGNAQIRMATGEINGQHLNFSFLRPATEEEISTYYADFYEGGPTALLPAYDEEQAMPL